MEISELNIYPVKSLGGIALPEAAVEERGFAYDRRWMIVDDAGRFLTQREYPLMATLRTALDENCLRITDGGGESLEIPLDGGRIGTARVAVWSSRVRAEIYADEINRWLGARLGAACRLAFMPDSSRRKVNFYYAVRKSEDVVSFADAYPYLLIGESSLTDLNARLAEPVPMNRFRPNLVVRGAPAFAEDGWKKVRVGATVFHVVKACSRCVVTTIDQATGTPQGKEPLKTLSTYRLVRRGGKAKINFGQNLIAADFGRKIRLGDPVEILETRR